MTKGKFITLEGIEGVGKTTNLKFITGILNQAKIDILITREPGGTKLAEKIRTMLLKHANEIITKEAELLLFFAARAQHVANVIRPALARGQMVISDRFTDASYAYQGGGRGIDAEHIAGLEKLVQGDLEPDLVLLLDIDPIEGLYRARGKTLGDRIEREEEEFFARARQVYLERAAANPNKYRIIDASKSLANVQENIANILQQELIVAHV